MRCRLCNGQGLIGGFEHGSAAPGYTSEDCPDCEGSGALRYRAVARNNSLLVKAGFEDVFKTAWFDTPQAALNDLYDGPNKWMRWSFAILIERFDGLRMWGSHSIDNYDKANSR